MRTLFFIFCTIVAATTYAEAGSVYVGKKAIEIFKKGKVLKEWQSGAQFNMFIDYKGVHYTCSIRVENELLGRNAFWCQDL